MTKTPSPLSEFRDLTDFLQSLNEAIAAYLVSAPLVARKTSPTSTTSNKSARSADSHDGPIDGSMTPIPYR